MFFSPDEVEKKVGADGASRVAALPPITQIALEVTEITSDSELKAKVLNSKKLGQRKNCNLPGERPCCLAGA